MKINKLISFLAAFLLSVSAFAAPPSDASIDELFSVTQLQSEFNEVLKNLEKEVAILVEKDASPNQEQRKQIDAIKHKVIPVIRQEMTWEKINPIFRQIFRETFSQEEVNAILFSHKQSSNEALVFYQSPTGQAILKKMPIAMEKISQAIEEQNKDLLQRITTIVAQEGLNSSSTTNAKRGQQ